MNDDTPEYTRLRRALHSALALLAQGGTPGGVAATLTANKITGTPRDSAFCPVARFLQAACGLEDVYVGPADVSAPIHGYGVVTVYLPGPVSTFVQLFDSGAYPALTTPPAGTVPARQPEETTP